MLVITITSAFGLTKLLLHSTPHHQTQISTDLSETTDYGCNDSSTQKR